MRKRILVSPPVRHLRCEMACGRVLIPRTTKRYALGPESLPRERNDLPSRARPIHHRHHITQARQPTQVLLSCCLEVLTP